MYKSYWLGGRCRSIVLPNNGRLNGLVDVLHHYTRQTTRHDAVHHYTTVHCCFFIVVFIVVWFTFTNITSKKIIILFSVLLHSNFRLKGLCLILISWVRFLVKFLLLNMMMIYDCFFIYVLILLCSSFAISPPTFHWLLVGWRFFLLIMFIINVLQRITFQSGWESKRNEQQKWHLLSFNEWRFCSLR